MKNEHTDFLANQIARCNISTKILKPKDLDSFENALTEIESRFYIIDLTVRDATSADQAGKMTVSKAIIEELEFTRNVLAAARESKDFELLTEVRRKLFPLEALTINYIHADTLLSHLRDTASEGLAICRGSRAGPSSDDELFFKKILSDLEASNITSEQQVRQTYLQARQRTMNLKIRRSSIVVMADRFVSILVRRTLIAVSLLIIPVLVFLFLRYAYSQPLEHPATEYHDAYIEIVPLLNQAGEGLGVMISRIATISVVAMAGVFGAFISNFARVRMLLEEVSAESTALPDRYFRVRQSPLIGALLALLLAEIFGAKLIQGDLFPMTELMPRWTDLIWHGGAFSKLIVWSFIAGLSESSILNLVGSLTSKLTGSLRRESDQKD